MNVVKYSSHFSNAMKKLVIKKCAENSDIKNFNKILVQFATIIPFWSIKLSATKLPSNDIKLSLIELKFTTKLKDFENCKWTSIHKFFQYQVK